MLACFLAVVRSEDGEEEVQEWVAGYLVNSRDKEFIIGTACTLSALGEDGSFDEARIGGCGACWQETGDTVSLQAGLEGLEAAKSCLLHWMPD